MATVSGWVDESVRRGEKVVVIIRNSTTGEEIVTAISPSFLSGLIGKITGKPVEVVDMRQGKDATNGRRTT